MGFLLGKPRSAQFQQESAGDACMHPVCRFPRVPFIPFPRHRSQQRRPGLRSEVWLRGCRAAQRCRARERGPRGIGAFSSTCQASRWSLGKVTSAGLSLLEDLGPALLVRQAEPLGGQSCSCCGSTRG